MAQPFDASRLALTGKAFPIADQIPTTGTNPPYAVFSVSENGVLAYETGVGFAYRILEWVDRSGKQIGTLGDPAPYYGLGISPDEKRASVLVSDGKQRNIWLYDLGRGLRTRFTFDTSDNFSAIWSPDGTKLVFNSRRKGPLDLYQKTSSGAGNDELLFEDTSDKYPTSWSPDGRFILYTRVVGNITSLWVLPLSGDPKPFPFLETQFNEPDGQFSPDGKWVAYSSNESGKYEVYVAPFPGAGGKWQISTAGGEWPLWRSDGKEIFYRADNKLTAATVNGKGANFEIGLVKPVFEAALGLIDYDVSKDGQRFLIIGAPEQTASTPITVVVNWTADLKK